MMAQKKSKRKQQHEKAIIAYKEWERKHPKATHEEKFQEFNILVDSSELVDALQTTAA